MRQSNCYWIILNDGNKKKLKIKKQKKIVYFSTCISWILLYPQPKTRCEIMIYRNYEENLKYCEKIYDCQSRKPNNIHADHESRVCSEYSLSANIRWIRYSKRGAIYLLGKSWSLKSLEVTCTLKIEVNSPLIRSLKFIGWKYLLHIYGSQENF